MSDNNQQKSILQQVTSELTNEKKKKVKGEVKELLKELQQAKEVYDGIVNKIEVKLSEVNETVTDLSKFLED